MTPHTMSIDILIPESVAMRATLQSSTFPLPLKMSEREIGKIEKIEIGENNILIATARITDPDAIAFFEAEKQGKNQYPSFSFGKTESP